MNGKVDTVNHSEVALPTALITGGHAGIGFECTRQLASQWKYNLVLAGRDLDHTDLRRSNSAWLMGSRSAF